MRLFELLILLQPSQESTTSSRVIVGNFAITEEPRFIADIAVGKLLSYIKKSRSNMVLDDTVLVHYKILSIEHIRQKIQETGYHVNKITQDGPHKVGSGSETQNSKYLLDPPMGYPQRATAFQDSCLLMCILLGLIQHELVKKKFSKEKVLFQNFFKRIKQGLSRRAGKHLHAQILMCTKKLGLSLPGPHDLTVCDSLAEYFNCQIIVYSPHYPPCIIKQSPREFTRSKKTVSLLQISDDHILLIKNLKTFFFQRGYVCASCYRSSKSLRQYHHKCIKKASLSCKKCFWQLQRPDTFTNTLNRGLLCNSEISKSLASFPCPHCAAVCNTRRCFQEHKKICRLLTVNEIGTCTFCGHEREENHQCVWATGKLDNAMINMAFFNFFYEASITDCILCYNDKCDLHEISELEKPLSPNVCGLMMEKEKHEHFVSRVWVHLGKKKYEYERHEGTFIYFDGSAEQKELNQSKPCTTFKKPRKVNPYFQEKITALQKKPNPTVVEKLLSYVLNESFINYSFVCNNQRDMDLLQQAFLTNDLEPKFLKRESRLIQIYIPFWNMRFASRKQFLQGDIPDLVEQFQFSKEETQFFPHALNCEKIYKDPPSSIPSLDLFFSAKDKVSLKNEKEAFWKRTQGQPWNFEDKLTSTMHFELRVLASACTNFIQSSIAFQKKCSQIFQKDGFLHPFSQSSIASFTFECFRGYALEPQLLYAIPNEEGKTAMTSQPEVEYTEFLRHCQFGGLTVQTEYSSSKGQLTFPEGKPDAYIPSLKLGIFYNGCQVHGCRNCCEDDDKRALFGETPREKRARDMKKISTLKNKYPDKLETTLTVWHCVFRKLTRQDKDVREFFEKHLFRPQKHLSPREALRGDFSEVYCLKWLKTDEEKFYALDLNSFYASVAMNSHLPVGKATYLVGNDFNQADIVLSENEFFLQGKRVDGLAQVQVFPPSNLLHPFLNFHKDGKNYFTLCARCVPQKRERCFHSEQARSWSATYTMPEILYAAKLGYKFFFYELMIYQARSTFLRRFVQILAFEKLRHSLPENYPESDLLKLDEDMAFHEIGLALANTRTTRNVGQTLFYKQALNSFFGELSTFLSQEI